VVAKDMRAQFRNFFKDNHFTVLGFTAVDGRANILFKMDDLALFDRSDGVNPFLLYNGHGSRFEEPFI
jgi:hypothetical protein